MPVRSVLFQGLSGKIGRISTRKSASFSTWGMGMQALIYMSNCQSFEGKFEGNKTHTLQDETTEAVLQTLPDRRSKEVCLCGFGRKW
jgi:hypothetical protein